MAFTTTAGNPSTIQGTTAVDVLATVPSNDNIIVYAGAEADVVNLQSTTATILNNVSVYGQAGADTITSAVGTHIVGGRTQGGAGNDDLNFATINSASVYGGADNDTIDVTLAVKSTIQGSKGNDQIGQTAAVGLQASKLYGGEGNDTIDVGSVVSSTVQGSKGDDHIDVNATVTGNSKIQGGADNDRIDIEATVGEITKGSTVNGNKGADIITVAAGVTVDDITIFGGSGNDNIDVADSETTISGDLGVDTITSGTGDDVSVSGGDGNDIITLETAAAANTQSANGGDGNDAITLGNDAGVTTVMLGRESSTAATAVTGNGGANDALADGDTVVFGNGVDAVANGLHLDTALYGTQLATTAANTSFRGEDNGGAKGGAITWGDLATAGTTFVLQGAWNAATGTFTINDTDGQDDILVIQGNGSALTANTSMAVLVNDGGLDFDGGANQATYLNGGMFTDYIA